MRSRQGSSSTLQHCSVTEANSKQLTAQQELAARGITVHIKFYSTHFIRNAVDRFQQAQCDIEAVAPYVYRLQSASDLHEYDSVLADIDMKYPPQSARSSESESSVVAYLRAIHPIAWTQFANSCLSSYEVAALATRWRGDHAYGSSLSLLGVRSTNAIEGEHTAMLWNNLRSMEPPAAVRAYCERTAQIRSRGVERGRAWLASGVTVTAQAKAIFDREVAFVPRQRVLVCLTRLYRVHEVGASVAQTVTVDMDAETCRRCQVHEQVLVPCRHILAVQLSENLSKTALDHFHPAYRVADCLAAFESLRIQISTYSECASDVVVLPPPRYGRPSKPRTRKDKAHREGRLKSRGELPRGAGSSDHALPTSPSVLFPDIRGPGIAVRREYKCSSCDLPGHNSRRCLGPPPSDDISSEPHEYLIGTCLFKTIGSTLAL